MAHLKVKKNQQAFSELELQQDSEYLVGRKDDCSLVLDPDPGISRHHFSINYNSENGWVVKVLSDHTSILHNGETLSELACDTSAIIFEIAPYTFHLDPGVVNSQPQTEPQEESLEFENANESNFSDKLDNNNPSAIAPIMADEWSSPKVESQMMPAENTSDELSFSGSEEKTSKLRLKGEPYLKFMYSTHSESIRLKGNKWIAGRDTIAQINLDDIKASRQHFSIEKIGESFYIKDLKSANGTLINGQDLTPSKSQQIKSGDIITVNQLTVIFELRDLSFSEKVSDLPLQAYSGPMILTSQEWGDNPAPGLAAPSSGPQKLSNEDLGQLPGVVEKLEPQKKSKTMILAAIAVIILISGFLFSGDKKPKAVVADNNVKNFNTLRPEEKKLVVETYNFINNLYKDDKFQLALNEINTLHKILPFYKDSKEIKAKCLQAKETLRQMDFIRQQQREQEETRQRVKTIIADCKFRFSNSLDLLATKACVGEAAQLDPDNSEILNLISGVELRLQKNAQDEEKRREHTKKVEKGVQLFLNAENLLKNKKYHKAIGAFSAHINANLPDPDKLKRKSKRNISSIERRIKTQKQRYMGQAIYQRKAGNLKRAILMAEKAKKIDPFDYKTANFIHKVNLNLTSHMRKLYTDSVIEEKFGNLELSRTNWQKIVETDIPGGEYYLKAKSKLQQYGL